MKKDDKASAPDDQLSFIDRFVGTKCLIRLITGHHVACTVKAVSPQGILVEEGLQNGKPVTKLIFRRAIAMIEPR